MILWVDCVLSLKSLNGSEKRIIKEREQEKAPFFISPIYLSFTLSWKNPFAILGSSLEALKFVFATDAW